MFRIHNRIYSENASKIENHQTIQSALIRNRFLNLFLVRNHAPSLSRFLFIYFFIDEIRASLEVIHFYQSDSAFIEVLHFKLSTLLFLIS